MSSDGTGQSSKLPSLPFIGPIEPWINLVHTVGMPWVIIGLSAYYGVPFARSISETALAVSSQQQATNDSIRCLKEQAEKAMPMLEEATKAIPLLRSIKDSGNQRHQDLQDLKTGN